MDIGQITGLSLASKFDSVGAFESAAKELGVKATNTEIFTTGRAEIHQCIISDLEDGTVYLGIRPTIGFSDGQGLPELEYDWINNFLAVQVQIDGIVGKVHRGFAQCCEMLWSAGVGASLEKRMSTAREFQVSGYSKGGGAAFIMASLMEWRLGVFPRDISVYAFAAPRAGDIDFQKFFDNTFQNAFRYEYQDDVITHMAPDDVFLEFLDDTYPIYGVIEKFLKTGEWNYKSCGDLTFIDWDENIVIGNEAIALEPKRIERYRELLKSDNRRKLGEDHSVPQRMYPVLEPNKPLPESILDLYR